MLKRSRLVVLVTLILALALACAAPESTTDLLPDDVAATAASEASDGAWLASVQRHLAEREYRASENGEGLQAPNRRHNLRTFFEPSGIRVHDRTAPGSPELLGLSLVGLGRGETLAAMTPGEVTSDGARVEIRRPELVEWYSNSEAGLEQGFTLPARPEGAGALALELAVEHASASLHGERVILATVAGRRLAYEKLVVVDATGAAVAARLEVPDPGHVRLVVADAGARYPLTIDPILTETADTQLESNQVAVGGIATALGRSVSGAGDVNGDGYDDVIVGADHYDAGESDEGAAFVFLGSASGIADGNPATAHAQLESDQADAWLGVSVSGAGDVNGDGYDDVIVGADHYDAGESNEGAAFVFLGSASGIADGNPATAHAQLESDQANAWLGRSVSGAGDVNDDGYDDIIVGAHEYVEFVDEVFYVGAAFVFLGSASGIADGNPATAHALFQGEEFSTYLGASVSGAGDVNGDGYDDVIVGARAYISPDNEGAAFVLLGSASGIAGGNPAIGVHATLTSDQAGARLGVSVSGAGDVNDDGYDDVIVGADGYDAGESDEGAAFVFLGSASGIAHGYPATAHAHAQLESNQAGAGLGVSVSGAGDVNGDGYDDVIVGAESYDAGELNEGAAFVFLGSASGIADGNPATAHAQLESDQGAAGMGVSVSGAGDVNGDGTDDVIVGADEYDAGEFREGAAFVYLGAPLLFVVDTTSDAVDANPGDGVCATAAVECSLRAAVMEANASPAHYTIEVPAGTYLLTLAGDGENAAATGDIDVTDDLILRGAGADCSTGTVISETTTFDLLEGAISVRAGAVEISDICITGSGRGMTAVGGRLDLHDFEISNNTWAFRNFLSGNARLRDGVIADNGPGVGGGGGVFNNGILHLDRMRIENNSSGGSGSISLRYGGIANNTGVLQVTNSSISGNSADAGSAIHNLATLLASNVSIFGNTAIDSTTQYGTLYNDPAAIADLTNVTIDGNTFGTASLTGGLGISVRNSILADTPGCAVAITSEGHNLEAGTSCGLTGTGDQQSVAIAFTQDSSGPTTTLVPTSGTNVQDLGDDLDCPHMDQRLHYRPPSGGCDIGAAELASAIACNNGLDDDGDGFCDAIGGACTDGSTPGDPGCADADDPQELNLVGGDVLVSDSGAAVKRLEPTTGDVRILSRGLGLRGPYAMTANTRRVFVKDGAAIFEIDRKTGLPSLLTAEGLLSAAPRGISLDRKGRLLVADTAGDQVVRVDPATGAQTLVSTGPPFTGPEYVLEDPTDGTLLVADYANATPQGIYRIDADTGAVLESCTGSPFGDPRQMVMSQDFDTLWVVDSGPNRVFEIDLTVSLNSCSPVQIGGGMGDAWGVALDANGDLIVASRNEGLFQFVDPSTGIQTVISESPDIVRPHEIVLLPDALIPIPVPEPGAMLSLASGLALLGLLNRRRWKIDRAVHLRRTPCIRN